MSGVEASRACPDGKADTGSAVVAETNGVDPAGVYAGAVLREAARVLGLMDREPFSPTRGCLDRTYWAWKFTDFPGARFQEGLCALSFLYAHAFEGNRFCGQAKLLEWIACGFDYWSRIQRSGGDFDEAYPFERSLAATAFTSFYLAEAWTLLDGRLPPSTAGRFKESLAKAGRWLTDNDETHGFLSNHLAAAAAALHHAFRITCEDRFEKRSRYFVDRILERQSEEGWYEEYGGADPGYQTHGTFYLARLWELRGDDRLLESLGHALEFLAHFVHADGSLGGEYASRNTQTYYPAAFEMLSAANGSATWIAQTMLPAVENLAAAGLGSVDAYNYFPLLNNNVFAYLACLKEGHRRCPAAPPAEGTVLFPEAGLVKVRTDAYDLFVGTHKGGVLKAFDRRRRRLLANDCGYLGRLKNGKLLSSQALDKGRPIEVSERRIVIKGAFYRIKKQVMKPASFVGFRLFSLTLGRWGVISRWLKSLLVKALIHRRCPVDLHFTRSISLDSDRITVRDHLQGSIGKRLESLSRQDVFTTIHMGSSRYFIPNELIDTFAGSSAGDARVDLTRLKQGVVMERTFVVR